MRNSIFYYLIFSFCLSCVSKETKSVDLEVISKDDSFRSAIKTGSFVKLSAGYTYYEYDNRNADTLIVMVHGFSVPSYIWDSTYQAAVQRGYGALRYDTYGRGYSDNPDVAYDVALYTNQLKELLDAVAVNKPINLMGLSDGGRTITGFAFQYPEKINNLIYVDAAGFETARDSANYSAEVSEREINDFKQARYATMASGQMTDFYDSISFRGWDKRYKLLMQHKGFVRALLSTNKNRRSLEIEHRKIAVSGIPVVAIWGEHDTVVKLDEVRANLMTRIPNVKLYVIPASGHLPHMEKTKLFNAVLFDDVILKRKG